MLWKYLSKPDIIRNIKMEALMAKLYRLMLFGALAALVAAMFFYAYRVVVELHNESLLATQKIENLTQQLNAANEIILLSSEFGFSTDIVIAVAEESRRRFSEDPTNIAWRLVRTPENLTYIMLSVIYAESAGDAKAVGDGGKARGLTQIWISTAKDYDPDATAEKLRNPEYNIRLGMDHFQRLLEKYRGNVNLALYSWNRGEGTVDSLLLSGYSDRVDNGFAQKVIAAVH